LDERLQEEIRYARRMKTQFSVVMMDLDGFKLVNDTHGHTIGDEILHSAFNYLAKNMRASDFLARYGGDELTLIVRDSGVEETKSVTQKIIDLMPTSSSQFPRPTTPTRSGLASQRGSPSIPSTHKQREICSVLLIQLCIRQKSEIADPTCSQAAQRDH